LHAGLITNDLFMQISLGVALVAALGAMIAGFNLRLVYDKSLLDWRLARSKRKSVLDNIEF